MLDRIFSSVQLLKMQAEKELSLFALGHSIGSCSINVSADDQRGRELGAGSKKGKSCLLLLQIKMERWLGGQEERECVISVTDLQ